MHLAGTCPALPGSSTGAASSMPGSWVSHPFLRLWREMSIPINLRQLPSPAVPTKASSWSQTTSVRKRTIPRVDVAMVRVSQLIPAAASGLVSAVGSSAHKSAQLLQPQGKFTPGRVNGVSCCRHRRSTRQGHPEHTPAPLGIPGLLSSPRTLCSGTSQFGRASAAFNL